MYNIFHVEGGIGKNIMGTVVARNIAKSFPENKTIVVSSYPEVYLHNPSIFRVFRPGITPYFYDDYIKDKNSKIFKFDPYNSGDYLNKIEHLTKTWCKMYKVKHDHITPELYFNKIEDRDVALLKQKYSPNKPYIVVQINGGIGVGENHVNLHWFRDMPPFYYQQIINKHSDKFNFIQFKNPAQTPLNNVISIELPLRESLNLLRGASGAICMDSMVQHAMAAFGISSIVGWVGNSPDVFGYNIHNNIKSNFKFETDSLEGYLEPYSIQSEGYQCPPNYNPEALFNPSYIIDAFEKLYVAKSE